MFKRLFWLFSLSFAVFLIIVLQPYYPQPGTAQTASTIPSSIDINQRHSQFVDIQEIIPDIQLDIRYYTDYNFVGTPIDGYDAPKCLLTKPAAAALANVQAELRKNDYALKVYDCYRPQQSVDHFVRWAQDATDTKMKSVFYPNIEKRDLFEQGYIAQRSGHSRGSTIDLTLVSLSSIDSISAQTSCLLDRSLTANSLDMGSAYDLFDPISHTQNDQITQTQLNHRLLLKNVMLKYGFRDYAMEWWHFTLKNEPFPETFFNFPIE